MSIIASLATVFGKAAAEKLIAALRTQEGGSKRLKLAAEAMATGATVIEALKHAFGKDFLSILNSVLGSSEATFSYEAGTQHYIRLDDSAAPAIQLLRDELNINLDRLILLKAKGSDLKNQARGVVAVWGERCRKLSDATKREDIESTLKTMDALLAGESRNYKQIFELLSKTSLGGAGTLLVIAGVATATSTGVGLASAIWTFLFGISWLTVGALVLPGFLALALAAKKTRPVDDLSLTVAMAYRLLERLSR